MLSGRCRWLASGVRAAVFFPESYTMSIDNLVAASSAAVLPRGAPSLKKGTGC